MILMWHVNGRNVKTRRSQRGVRVISINHFKLMDALAGVDMKLCD